MSVPTTLIAMAIGGLIVATTSLPAGAQSTDTVATKSASGVSGAQDILGILSPLLNNATQHATPKNCKPDSLYSAHDVIGDSDSCFVSKVDVRGGSTVGNGSGVTGVF